MRYLPEYLSRELGLELTPISLSDRGMDVFGDYSYTLAGGAWLSKDYAYMKSINFNRLTVVPFGHRYVIIVSCFMVCFCGFVIECWHV